MTMSLPVIASAAMATIPAFARGKSETWVVESPNDVLAAPPVDPAQIVIVEPINRLTLTPADAVAE